MQQVEGICGLIISLRRTYRQSLSDGYQRGRGGSDSRGEPGHEGHAFPGCLSILSVPDTRAMQIDPINFPLSPAQTLPTLCRPSVELSSKELAAKLAPK